MGKDLRESKNQILNNAILKVGNSKNVFYKIAEVGDIDEIIKIMRVVSKAEITYDRYLPNFYKKIESSRVPYIYFIREKLIGGYCITPSPLGYKIIKILNVDIESIEKTYSQHNFHPLYIAFSESVKELQKKFDLHDLAKKQYKNIDFSETRPYIQALYEVVVTLKNNIDKYARNNYKNNNSEENNFDRVVRQNARGLQGFLEKIIRPRRETIKVTLDLCLFDTKYKQPEMYINEQRLEEFVRRKFRPKNVTIEAFHNPRWDLYETLRDARAEYVQMLRRHDLFKGYLEGYMWKLDHKCFTSWTYRLVLFFKSSPKLPVIEILEECRYLWLHVTGLSDMIRVIDINEYDTHQEPIYSVVIKPTVKSQSAEVAKIVDKYIRPDHFMRVKLLTDKQKTFGKSQIKK